MFVAALQKAGGSSSSADAAVASCSKDSRKRKAPCATVTDPKKACDWFVKLSFVGRLIACEMPITHLYSNIILLQV